MIVWMILTPKQMRKMDDMLFFAMCSIIFIGLVVIFYFLWYKSEDIKEMNSALKRGYKDDEYS